MSSADGPLLGLEGRMILVTGAGGGIGAAVAKQLLAAKAQVLSIDLPGVDGPDGSDCLHADLSLANEVHDLFGRIRKTRERVDGIVHCAGITRDAVLWKMSDEDWNAVLRVNLDGAFYLLRDAVPLMRAGGGSIVLLSSINGERGKFGQSNYTASKAGLIGLARTAARELGGFGIRVNVIAPGLIRTEMTANLPPEVIERSLQECVLGRLGETEDVAGVAHFLLSDLSRHMTGQVLRVDGGQLIG